MLTRLTLRRRAVHDAGVPAAEFLIVKCNVPFYFGGTSLLIIVVVTMDFMAQVQAYLMSHQYESLLKKANFKGGYGRGGQARRQGQHVSMGDLSGGLA